VPGASYARLAAEDLVVGHDPRIGHTCSPSYARCHALTNSVRRRRRTFRQANSGWPAAGVPIRSQAGGPMPASAEGFQCSGVALDKCSLLAAGPAFQLMLPRNRRRQTRIGLLVYQAHGPASGGVVGGGSIVVGGQSGAQVRRVADVEGLVRTLQDVDDVHAGWCPSTRCRSLGTPFDSQRPVACHERAGWSGERVEWCGSGDLNPDGLAPTSS
jgi:hypothetical protein